ncbi:MAG: TonB family protein [Bacteroidetes bacterium]|nr:TonB family protein [Bacteroidota bacterium]MCW5895652.1 TonB family protein [Bacteroidota bacterium]
MKRHLVVFLLFFVGTWLNAQEKDGAFEMVDKEPAITSRVHPVYPKEAMENNLEGLVWLKVLVSDKGVPVKIEVLKSSEKAFEQSAIDAARQFRFSPGTIKEKPVACWVSIPFKFKLSPKSDIIKKNSEELPKKIKSPTVLIVEGPASLEAKIAYPPEAVSKRIEGAVFASVALNEEKRISEVKITKRLGGGCDEEVLKAITAYKFYEEKSEGGTDKKQSETVPVVVQFVLPSK